MALSFPGKSGELWEVIAWDAFLDALTESDLRLRVAERDPSTLEEALRVACRLEALRRPEQAEQWDELGRRRERVVRAVEPVASGENRATTSLLQDLASEVRRCGERLERMEDMSRDRRTGGDSAAVAGRGPGRDGPFDQPHGGWSSDRHVPSRHPPVPSDTTRHED